MTITVAIFHGNELRFLKKSDVDTTESASTNRQRAKMNFQLDRIFLNHLLFLLGCEGSWLIQQKPLSDDALISFIYIGLSVIDRKCLLRSGTIITKITQKTVVVVSPRLLFEPSSLTITHMHTLTHSQGMLGRIDRLHNPYVLQNSCECYDWFQFHQKRSQFSEAAAITKTGNKCVHVWMINNQRNFLWAYIGLVLE